MSTLFVAPSLSSPTKNPARPAPSGVFLIVIQQRVDVTPYSPAAARRASTLSVFSQLKVVKVSVPTVFSCGMRPKWP